MKRHHLQFHLISTTSLLLPLSTVLGCAVEDEAIRGRSQEFEANESVFINEIHYDNDGTDAGEAIEIAGPAGTDLSSYSLVLYNGANGLAYDTRPLSGMLSNQSSGYGFQSVTFGVNGLQNGSPDGVALVRGTEVIEFISYEGTFAAADGPAAGLTATDVGVFEAGTTPLGASLQRTGSGVRASDFSWIGPIPGTFGLVNTGQSFGDDSGSGGASSGGASASGGASGGGAALGAPFINEFHYDNVGADTGEAVEIAGPAGTDLGQYSLVLYNGSNSLVYRTEALSGVLSDQASGFGFSVVDLPTDGIQNGAPDGIALVRGSEVIEFLSYEGTMIAADGPAAGVTSVDVLVQETGSTPVGASLQRVGTGNLASHFVWSGPTTSTFGFLNDGQSFGELGSGGSGSGGAPGSGGTGGLSGCGAPATPIGSVQGPGEVSPRSGEVVSVEGIVIGDYQGAGAELGGFFIQSEVADVDPATSEGLFIFDQNLSGGPQVALGDRVRVTGGVSEYFGLTEVTASAIEVCGTGSMPTPLALAFPLSSPGELERLEGMLVSVNELTVTETYNLGRYGEVLLAAGGRLFNPTNETGTSSSDNDLRSILLDDARDAQNVEPVPYLGTDGTLRIGDLSNSFNAVLSYGFDVYRLQPVDRAQVIFTRSNPRTEVAPEVGGDVKVAALNVLNYFVTLGDRGANSAAEFELQKAKLVQAIIGLDADVLGLMEMENNDASGAPLALDDLVLAINTALGGPVYARAPDPTFTGTDRIRTAILYKPARVDSVGLARSSSDPVHSRPPIAETFSYKGDRFTVIVNHLKSKGSCPSSSHDENADYGQGCWNALRSEQAQALLSFIEERKLESGDEDVVILGDFNSYLEEDPIGVLEAGGMVNQDRLLAPGDRYSYVFDGESGTLDYAMTSPSLAVSGRAIWHINADEPRILDYNTEFNPPSLYVADAFRSSDHDPILLGLSFPRSVDLLFDELKDAIVASGAPRARLLLLLAAEGLADAAYDLSNDLETKAPRLAAAARRVAEKELRALSALVSQFAKKRYLSEAAAADLIERVEEILLLL